MNKERLNQIAIEQGFQRRTLEGSHVHTRIMELLKVGRKAQSRTLNPKLTLILERK